MKSMNFPNRNYLLLFVLAIFWLASSCENDEKDLPQFRKKQISVDEGRDIVSYMSENAKVKAKLTSPYMLRSETDSSYVEFPRTLHVDFYNDSMVIESQMDALYGRWIESQSKVFLKDSVVVKNILKGDTLRCQELWWDQKLEKFYTDKPVRIYRRGGTVNYGTGFEAPQDFSGYTIFNLSGTYGVADKSVPK